MLLTKNLKPDQLSCKLAYRVVKPFVVKEPIGLQVYRLYLLKY